MIATSMAVESAAEITGMPRVDGVEHRFVDAGGLRTHVAEAGAGEPIVLLHGWPQHWYEWRHLIGPLGERYRVICPDLRGLGWTDAPAKGYEKENLATDVLNLLDELGVERFRLIGHDWGGWAGYLICLREPERVEAYMPLNIYPPFLRATPAQVLRMWRFWYQLVIAAPFVGRWSVAQIARRNPVLDWIGVGSWLPPEREAFLGRLRDPARANASVQYYRSFQLREMPAIAAGRYRNTRMRTRTRLLFGTEDRVQPPEALEGSEAYADDFSYELFPGVGHFIADEIPEAVVDRALAFFERD
jgi:pimeloyl-ACP methyl ester carboxylesterase